MTSPTMDVFVVMVADTLLDMSAIAFGELVLNVEMNVPDGARGLGPLHIAFLW